MKKFAAIIIGLTGAESAFAGAVTGHVVNVRVDSTGYGIVYFDQNLTGPAGCIAVSYENALTFNANTAGGKAIMVRALAAKASEELIKVVGSGACSNYPNYAEDWLYGDVETY